MCSINNLRQTLVDVNDIVILVLEFMWLSRNVYVLQNGIYDESVGSFFRNVDSRYENASDIPFGQGQGKIKSLKARVSKMICSHRKSVYHK